MDTPGQPPAPGGIETLTRTVLESIGEAFFTLDRDWRFSYVNSQTERVLDRAPGELLGRVIWTEYPGIRGTDFERIYLDAFHQGQPGTAVAYYPHHDRWYDVRTYPFAGGIAVHFRDVTAERNDADALRRTEARLRRVQRIGRVGGFEIDLRSGANHRSAEYMALHGRPARETEERHADWVRRLHPEDRERAERAFLEATADGSGITHYAQEYRIVTSTGEVRWIAARAEIERDAEGRALFMRGAHLDVTEQKAAEAALAASEARLTLALEGTSDGIWDWDMAAGTVYFSPRLLGMLGYAPDAWEPSYAAWRAHVHPDDVAPAEDTLRRYLAGEIAEYASVFRMRHAKGSWRWILSRAKVRRDAAGRPVRMVGAHTDITAQKSAEARQRYLLALAEATRDHADPAAMMEAGTALLGRELGVARLGFAEVDETGQDAIVRRHFGDGRLPSMVGTWHLEDFGPDFIRAMREGCTVAIPDVWQDPRTGAPPWRAAFDAVGTRATLHVPLLRAGRMVALLFTHDAVPRNWTPDEVAIVEETCARLWAAVERARAEERLRESEARFRTLADAMPQMIWSTRPDGFHDYYNARWYEYTGVPAGSTDGEGWAGMFHPEDQPRAWERWRHSLATGEPYEVEYRLRRHDGVYRWTLGRALPMRDDSGAITRWFGTCTDIHDAKEAAEILARGREELERLVEQRTAALLRAAEERRRAEDAMRQSEKLAALGQLTGGVAHDFNNLLQVVSSGAALLGRPGLSEERRALVLKGIIAAGQSARELTGRLLAFARRQALAPETLDLNARLDSLTDLLRQTLGRKIKVETRFAPDLWSVHCDPGGLEVALLNLAANARDAMPGGGTLTLVTRNVTLPAAGERAAGDYAMLEVTDTGEGMTPAIVARVFEPFFTTKEAGRGTGLGLPQVFGFAKQSGGDIRVESEPGRGTSVCIYLPRATAPPAVTETPTLSPGAAVVEALRLSAGRTVLVVEDNREAGDFAAALLEELGFATRRAASGKEALGLLATGASFDAVFSDVVMPGGVSGLDLAAGLRAAHPDVAVVLTTGYSARLAERGPPPGVEVLGKPYRLDELAAALGRALAAVTRSEMAAAQR